MVSGSGHRVDGGRVLSVRNGLPGQLWVERGERCCKRDGESNVTKAC